MSCKDEDHKFVCPICGKELVLFRQKWVCFNCLRIVDDCCSGS